LSSSTITMTANHTVNSSRCVYAAGASAAASTTLAVVVRSPAPSSSFDAITRRRASTMSRCWSGDSRRRRRKRKIVVRRTTTATTSTHQQQEQHRTVTKWRRRRRPASSLFTAAAFCCLLLGGAAVTTTTTTVFLLSFFFVAGRDDARISSSSPPPPAFLAYAERLVPQRRKGRRTSRGRRTNSFFHFDLHPAGFDDEERRRQRQLRKVRSDWIPVADGNDIDANNDKNSSFATGGSSIADWNLTTTQSSSWLLDVDEVAATLRRRIRNRIPDRDDPRHVDNRMLHEFYAYRHLSRYERRHRQRNNLDLQLDWDGTYDDDDEEEEEENNVISDDGRKSPLMNRSDATTETASALSSTADKRRLQGEQHDRHGNIKHGGGQQQQQQQHRQHPASKQQQAATTTTTTTTTTHLPGGKFDNYQDVPLSQGYGTHFANVWVGAPTPQRKTVIGELLLFLER